MFGITIIKTVRLHEMKQQIKDKDATIGKLQKEVEDLTPKRNASGKFVDENGNFTPKKKQETDE